METPITVEVSLDIEYEVGSPANDMLDSDRIGDTPLARWQATWMSREGLIEGAVINAAFDLYPHFTDVARRIIFAAFTYESNPAGSWSVIPWNGYDWNLGNIFLTTDPGWPSPVGLGANQDGGWWFAVEGELEDDYRIWKKGVPGTVTL